jgi:2-aminoadipate transaminase
MPAEQLALAVARVLRDSPELALQYGTSQGVAGLREWVAEHLLPRWGVAAEADDVYLTSGSQQALDLLGKVLLDEGDSVLLESPSYLSAIQAFGLYRPSFEPITLEDEGLELEALARRLALVGQGRAPRPKFLYVSPDFQNPSGVCYSPAKREKLAELAARHDLLLVEDRPYGELWFETPPPRPVSALLPGRGVLLGTFSKILTPGLRLGFMVVPPSLRPALDVARQASDLCGSMLVQHATLALLRDFPLDEHLTRVRRAYAERRDAMLQALHSHWPEGYTARPPGGGMFLWVKGPEDFDSDGLLPEALRAQVAFAPGSPFFTAPEGRRHLRLNFTGATPERIDTGMRRLGALLGRPAPGAVSAA